MWCIIFFGAIGLIVGIIFAVLDGEIGNVFPCTFAGAIAGVLITVLLSIGVWIFAPESAYSLAQTTKYTVAQNNNGELLYFNITHDKGSTYLYYLNEKQEVKKVYLSSAEVRFIENEEPTRIEAYQWQYNNSFLRAIAIVPMSKWNNTTYIYISEDNWLKHTEGGIEHVVTHPIQN